MSLNEIEEIKQRLNIVDLIGQYVALKKAGVNYKAVCPFHQEKTPSLMVSPEKQIWKCFGCGKGGSVFDFVMEAEHLEFGDALRLLAQKTGVELKARTAAEHQTRDKKEPLYRINDLSARVFQKVLLEDPSGRVARDYLTGRGIKAETCEEFRLGFAPRKLKLKNFLIKRGFTSHQIAAAGNPDKFYDRIMFPIFDVLGHVIAFTGRSLDDQTQPKYLNSPETLLFNKGRTLYGLNFAKAAIKERDYVILVEGQMDVLSLHQMGNRHAVASSGTAITEAQILTLSKYTQNFMLAFDADEAGRATTRKVIEILLVNDLNGRVVDYSPYKDAGELMQKEPKAWPIRLKGAKEMIDWLIGEELASIGKELRFIEQKKRVIKSLLPYLALIREPSRLDLSLQRLALAVGVKSESLHAALLRLKSTARKPADNVSVAKPTLTNEEQLLSLVISRPHLAVAVAKQLEAVFWQSEDSQSLAGVLRSLYTDKVLTKNQSAFISRVKSQVSPAQAGKVDSMQFWVESSWPDLADEVALELMREKLGLLATKDYERQKNELARQIRLAQESGDLKAVKTLMNKLNKLTKKESSTKLRIDG